MSFARALPIILKAEGGYVHDPADRGGETNLGVTVAVWAQWCADQRLPPKPMRELTEADVTPLYRARYWLPAFCEQLPWPLSLVHFDTAVNSGPAQAAKLLQRALAVPADGAIGPRTLAAAATAGSREAYRYLLERVFFYRGLARRDASQTKFLVGGWLGRVEHLYREVG